MRGVFIGMWSSLGSIAVILLSIYMGIASHSWIVLIFSLVAGFGMIGVGAGAITRTGRINMDSWLSSVNHCNYKYAWDGSGIAIDNKNKKIYLSSRFDNQSISNAYSFSDIREWGYEIPGVTTQTSGTIIGMGIQGAAHNTGSVIRDSIVNAVSANEAAENTGLWLKVRDIEFPKWFIKFSGSEMELNRWMEILRQSINENIEELNVEQPRKLVSKPATLGRKF